MQRVWLKKYPKGVSQQIDLMQYRSIPDLMVSTCAKFGSKPAFANMGRTLSFELLDRYSLKFASYLQNQLGLKKGDRIAIQMPNCLQYPIALHGALRAGLVIVNTNPLYTPREMEHQFNDAGCSAVIVLANFASHVQEVLPKTKIKHVIITELGDMLGFPKSILVNLAVKYVKKMVPNYSLPNALSFMTCLQEGDPQKFKAPEINIEDLAFLQYTGGTTGVAKGAMLTQKNILANMEQIRQWMGPKLIVGEEIIITALPLYHIFSLTVNCMAFFTYGGLNILITNPKDIPGFIKELKKWKFTAISGVNTLFNALMNNPQFTTIDFSSLKISVAGGMALQQAVAKRWMSLTKTVVVEGYGLTESSPVASCNPIDGSDKIGTIGLPLPSTDMKVIDDSGADLPSGEAGELCIKGPQVMRGYWQRDEETKKVITADGWLKTGDVAVEDSEGYFKIVDRKKDMILVSGFNVYPNEIEDVVASMPKVLEVAAIGVPDEHSGEVVKLFIVKKDPSLTAEEVIQFCRKEMTSYKVPRAVEFRTELPKTNIGKILRRALR